MPDIRSYLKEKEKRERNQSDYKDKIKQHKRAALYRILLVLLVIIAVLALVVIQYKRRVYTSYHVINSVGYDRLEGVKQVRLKDAILTYSNDGAHCTDAKGNVTWNQTYEIQDIRLAISQDVVAIGDYNGRSIYVQNTQKQLGTITTTMPIKDIAVASTGYVTAVLEDADVTWINTYGPDGKNIYSGQTRMQNSGYPAAISLSPNGELLAVSYVYVDAGVLKTNIAFYNFGPVGSNQSDHLVGVRSYTDMLVPEIHFINNDTAFAVGDSRLMLYKGSQKPVSHVEHLYDRDIQSVFYSEKYIGLVFLSDQTESRYMLKVYDVNGKQIGNYYFDMEYQDIFFTEEGIVIYNDKECKIMTFAGMEKYHGSFERSVNLMLPTSTPYRYLLMMEDSMDTIQLN